MSTFDFENCYAAVAARDPRLDGRAFTAVRTTGVYCRPSCPARTPKAENISFFPTAAAARRAGYRACKRCHPDAAAIELRLPVREPFDGDELLAFFAARAVPGVEEVADGELRRSLRLEHGTGVVELRPARGHVDASFWLEDHRDFDDAERRARAMLDLDADPEAIADALGGDPMLGAMLSSSPGRRVPGHPDGAELAVRAVLGQQVTVAAARTQAARLVAARGEPLEQPVGAVTHLFPSSQAIAESAGVLAMPGARRRAVVALASLLASQEIVLSSNPDNDREHALKRLSELPGIGPWTTSYIAMRALRDPDAFLAGDIAIRNEVARLGADDRPAAVAALAERWRPFRSYAVVHLWASLAAAAPATVNVAA